MSIKGLFVLLIVLALILVGCADNDEVTGVNDEPVVVDAGSVEILEPEEGDILAGEEKIRIEVRDLDGNPFLGSEVVYITFTFSDDNEKTIVSPERVDFSDDPEGEHTTGPAIKEMLENIEDYDVDDVVNIEVEVGGFADDISVGP